jgi:hypothetical protein
MDAYELSVASSDVGRRCAVRLRNGASSSDVVWQIDGRSLLVHTASLAVRALDGWLLINLDVETDQTKKQTLQFVFYLGKRSDLGTLNAACTINAPSVEAGQLADGWGRDLQRVLWDGVLDAVESCVSSVAGTASSQPLTLQSFFAEGQTLVVTVLAGA